MGKVTVVGGKVGMEKPSGGILASDLAVGSSVYLMESGSPVEYLVVNQGIPSNASLYNGSCNGTWLLRKDIKENRQYHNEDYYSFQFSDVHTYLNDDFYMSFDDLTKNAIETVKVPFIKGTSVVTGEYALESNVFLLSYLEVGFTGFDSHLADGVKLDYFEAGSGTSANNKRIATLNGSASWWWTRSPSTTGSLVGQFWSVKTGGSYDAGYRATESLGVRPALVISGNTVIDSENMTIKGVV